MSEGTAKIGSLWELGESQFKSGDALEALLNFQRAKTLLITESNGIYANPTLASGKASKLMGEIMQKLTGSIDRASTVLNKNPVMALGLGRGFTKSDVKKAYRKAALRYHPDKNQDCDSSCIFTAIQSAYEKLEATAPAEAPATSTYANYYAGAATATAQTTAASYASAFAPRAPNQPQPSGGGGRAGENNRNSANNAGDGGYIFKTRETRDAKQPPPSSSSSSSSSSSAPPRQREAEMKSKSDRDRAAAAGGANPASAEDRFYELSTDMLRSLLKEFGFSVSVDDMPRNELLRKYLQVTAHLSKNKDGYFDVNDRKQQQQQRQKQQQQQQQQQEQQDSGWDGKPHYHSMFNRRESEQRSTAPKPTTRDSGKVETDRCGGDTVDNAQRWLNEWTKRVRAEREKERDIRQRLRPRGGLEEPPVGPPKSAGASRGPRERRTGADAGADAATAASTAARSSSQPGNSSGKQGGNGNGEARAADDARRHRVEKLVVELPAMPVADLRRLMALSGVSAEGCIEKRDMLERLYAHFGINDISASGAPGSPGTFRAAPPQKEGATVTPAEAAMRARNVGAAAAVPAPSRGSFHSISGTVASFAKDRQAVPPNQLASEKTKAGAPSSRREKDMKEDKERKEKDGKEKGPSRRAERPLQPLWEKHEMERMGLNPKGPPNVSDFYDAAARKAAPGAGSSSAAAAAGGAIPSIITFEKLRALEVKLFGDRGLYGANAAAPPGAAAHVGASATSAAAEGRRKRRSDAESHPHAATAAAAVAASSRGSDKRPSTLDELNADLEQWNREQAATSASSAGADSHRGVGRRASDGYVYHAELDEEYRQRYAAQAAAAGGSLFRPTDDGDGDDEEDEDDDGDDELDLRYRAMYRTQHDEEDDDLLPTARSTASQKSSKTVQSGHGSFNSPGRHRSDDPGRRPADDDDDEDDDDEDEAAYRGVHITPGRALQSDDEDEDEEDDARSDASAGSDNDSGADFIDKYSTYGRAVDSMQQKVSAGGSPGAAAAAAAVAAAAHEDENGVEEVPLTAQGPALDAAPALAPAPVPAIASAPVPVPVPSVSLGVSMLPDDDAGADLDESGDLDAPKALAPLPTAGGAAAAAAKQTPPISPSLATAAWPSNGNLSGGAMGRKGSASYFDMAEEYGGGGGSGSGGGPAGSESAKKRPNRGSVTTIAGGNEASMPTLAAAPAPAHVPARAPVPVITNASAASRVVITLARSGQYPLDSLSAVITAAGLDSRPGVQN